MDRTVIGHPTHGSDAVNELSARGKTTGNTKRIAS